MTELELVACYCCRCYRWFYTETDEVKCCPYCGSRRVSVEYDVVVTAVGRSAGRHESQGGENVRADSSET